MVHLTSGMEYANVDTLILVFSSSSLMVSCRNCLRCKLEFGLKIMYMYTDKLLLFIHLAYFGGQRSQQLIGILLVLSLSRFSKDAEFYTIQQLWELVLVCMTRFQDGDCDSCLVLHFCAPINNPAYACALTSVRPSLVWGTGHFSFLLRVWIYLEAFPSTVTFALNDFQT